MVLARKHGILAIAIGVGLFTASCEQVSGIFGESKTKQCNKLIELTNTATRELQASTQNRPESPEAAADQLDQIAGKLDGYATSVKDLQLADESLQGFQGRFVTLYEQTAGNSRDVAEAIKAKDMKAANAALKELQTRSSEETKLVGDVNTYCQESSS